MGKKVESLNRANSIRLVKVSGNDVRACGFWCECLLTQIPAALDTERDVRFQCCCCSSSKDAGACGYISVTKLVRLCVTAYTHTAMYAHCVYVCVFVVCG